MILHFQCDDAGHGSVHAGHSELTILQGLFERFNYRSGYSRYPSDQVSYRCQSGIASTAACGWLQRAEIPPM